jgi:hypothetical protein
MTFVRRGSVVQFPRTGRAEVVRTRDELTRAIDRIPGLHGPSGWSADQVAWLGPTRLAVVAVAVPSRSVLVVLSGQRVVAYRRRIPPTVTELRASPRGNYLVLRTARGVQVYDARTPGLRPLRRLGEPAAVAWSSDERWLAVAGADGVVLRRPGAQIALPLAAVDLAWTRTLS